MPPPALGCRKNPFLCSLAAKNPIALQVVALLVLLHKHLKNQHFLLSIEPKLTAVFL